MLLILIIQDDTKDFSKRYTLIITEAKKLGYNQIELLPWTGQNSGVNGLMNLITGTTLLTAKINELEKTKLNMILLRLVGQLMFI